MRTENYMRMSIWKDQETPRKNELYRKRFTSYRELLVTDILKWSNGEYEIATLQRARIKDLENLYDKLYAEKRAR